MLTVNALIAASEDGLLERAEITRRDLMPHDVLIAIAFVGVCHSDIHMVRNEWGETNYPIVPGHEIAGIVEEAGPAVTRFAVGDRAGVGCYIDSCRRCKNCLAQQQQFCVRGETETYNSIGVDGQRTQGGYSTHIVVDENYVLRVPDALELAAAAPLLCAGISMYSPLMRCAVGDGKRVAIVGLGGLGHVGVQIASALGAEVAVISRSAGKAKDARRFGASRFLNSTDEGVLARSAKAFDVVANTASSALDLDPYLHLLDMDGVLIYVGLPPGMARVAISSLIDNRRALVGSKNGGIAETQEMLDFCAEHNIRAEPEIIAAENVNDAYDRVLAGQVRYRYVVDATTF